jgi:hypothetical protein
MSINYEGGAAGIRQKKLTTTSVTDIVAETNKCIVKKVYACEIAGGVSAFTLEIYDVANTTSYYLMSAKPMTARQTLEWEDIVLEPGWKLRATAGIANNIDVIAVIVEPGQG